MSSNADSAPQADDVLEQLPLPRIGVRLVGHLGQRHTDDLDVGAEFLRRHRLGVVVEQIAARLDRRRRPDPRSAGSSPPSGRRRRRARQMAGLGNAHLVPGRQALDIRRERCCAASPATPIRRTALANSALALADPDPLTLANLTTKSLTRWRPSATRSICCSMRSPPEPHRSRNVAYPTRRSGSVRRTTRNAGRRPRPSP